VLGWIMSQLGLARSSLSWLVKLTSQYDSAR
jgi:hypothetical protein